MKSLENLVEVFSEESTHTVERAYVIRKTGSLLPATGVFLWSSKMGGVKFAQEMVGTFEPRESFQKQNSAKYRSSGIRTAHGGSKKQSL